MSCAAHNPTTSAVAATENIYLPKLAVLDRVTDDIPEVRTFYWHFEVKDALASRLGAGRRAAARVPTVPPVDEILDVDREYRDQAQSGKLPLISPRRFNPQRERWLPILHTTRGDRHYTALYSNTAVAHRLDRVRDWVVLYFDGGDGERQCTVVTEFRGALRGERVVRGRERECFDYYGLGAARPEAVSK